MVGVLRCWGAMLFPFVVVVSPPFLLFVVWCLLPGLVPPCLAPPTPHHLGPPPGLALPPPRRLWPPPPGLALPPHLAPPHLASSSSRLLLVSPPPRLASSSSRLLLVSPPPRLISSSSHLLLVSPPPPPSSSSSHASHLSSSSSCASSCASPPPRLAPLLHLLVLRLILLVLRLLPFLVSHLFLLLNLPLLFIVICPLLRVIHPSFSSSLFPSLFPWLLWCFPLVVGVSALIVVVSGAVVVLHVVVVLGCCVVLLVGVKDDSEGGMGGWKVKTNHNTRCGSYFVTHQMGLPLSGSPSSFSIPVPPSSEMQAAHIPSERGGAAGAASSLLRELMRCWMSPHPSEEGRGCCRVSACGWDGGRRCWGRGWW
jgi:hypothetical protein